MQSPLCDARILTALHLLERLAGIEPASQEWRSRILPLNHNREGRREMKRRCWLLGLEFNQHLRTCQGPVLILLNYLRSIPFGIRPGGLFGVCTLLLALNTSSR